MCSFWQFGLCWSSNNNLIAPYLIGWFIELVVDRCVFLKLSGYDINELLQAAQTRWLKPVEVLFILQNHANYQITQEAPQKPPSKCYSNCLSYLLYFLTALTFLIYIYYDRWFSISFQQEGS